MGEADPGIEEILKGAASTAERAAVAGVWLDANLRRYPQLSRRLIDLLLAETLAAGEVQGSAWLRFFLGWLFLLSDETYRAIPLFETARSAFEDSGNAEGLSRSLNALGVANLALGIYDLALDQFRDSMRKAEGIHRKDLAGTASMNTAECLYELGEPEEALAAIEYCRRNCTIAPHNIANCHSQAGMIYRSLGKLEEAEGELLEAIRAAGAAVHDSLEAKQVLAEVRADAGRFEEAAKLAEAGIEECAASGDRLIEARFFLTRARLSDLRGDAAGAIPDLESAIAMAREIGARKIETDAEKALSAALQKGGDCAGALAAFMRHAELKDRMRNEQTSRRIIGLHDERARVEARHFEALYREISNISEIGQRITANLDLDAVLEMLYGAINGLMDAPTLLLALVDEDSESLDYRLVISGGKRADGLKLPLEADSFGCRCAVERKDILIGNLDTESAGYAPASRELLRGDGLEKSLMFVPLVVEDKVVGALSAQSRVPDSYDRRKLEILRAVGTYVAIAIENSKLFDQIQKLATVDSLTGIFNRRKIGELIEIEYRKFRRYGGEVSVITVDLDNFKQVNDTYGHASGDEVLRAIAGKFAAVLRGIDQVGRFGGEEFVILLPGTNLAGSLCLAERLREGVADLEITVAEGARIRTTASFGISTMHKEDESHEDVLRRSDLALYAAKEDGKNRVRSG